MELSITVSALRRMVDPILPLASSDGMLPVLCAVHFTAQNGVLMAEATDRFVMGMTRREHPGAPDGLDWLIDAADLKAILRTFRPSRDSDPTLILTADENDVLWVESQEQGGLIDFVSARVGYRLAVGEFPKIRRVFRTAYDRGVIAEPISLNAEFLAKFKALGREGVTFRVGGIKKTTVITRHNDRGELDFAGLIMARAAVEGAEGDLWPELSDDEPTKAVA
jgi:DNA polymerase III sliding clamp (beta) subunit (PCNA family)